MTLQDVHPLAPMQNRIQNDNKFVRSIFRYTLKCDECLWNTSFYEASGSLHLASHKIVCPLCKNNELGWIKSLL